MCGNKQGSNFWNLQLISFKKRPNMTIFRKKKCIPFLRPKHNIGGDVIFTKIFGGRKEFGENFHWVGHLKFLLHSFSHFLMTIFFEFLRPPPPKNSPNFSACGGLKSFGNGPQSPSSLKKKALGLGGRGAKTVGGFSLGGGHVKFLVKSLVTFL